MAAPIPKKIGKYDVLDVVGKGGMGVVYRAKDPFLDRMVAIKIMTISYADYPDLLQRFYREAKATANLQHPNIVTVYELGEHEGSPYLAMQFLEGASLEVILRSGQPLSLMQKIDVIVQACHGLSYAHQRGIVHRDIKPGNIMVLKDGSVKIVDFGIARIGDTNFTRTGQFMGSLNYMSLEQLNDKLQVDQRTDVYSTGVVLYQILTGALPFEAESTGATLMKILNEAPPPFSKYLSSYSPELESITMKALAKDRDQRYSSADELALDLAQLLDRMKGEKIQVHMQAAERFVSENQLFQANDALMEVLKLDKQNTKAAAMLRTLRKQIEKEQSAERARQLREQAEEAFSREDFEPALTFIEQAIQIEATNVDLQNFRTKIQAAKAEIEHLRQVMQRAENAHRAGNLDTAKQAIEEVLARRPNDTRVKSLYRLIQKELDDRMRQKRIETLLEAARKEMTNRHFTSAFDILKEAEKVDPEAPALRSLLDTFTASRDQEQKRRAIEQLTRQIEQAVNADDNQTALNLLNEGLQRFPAEPGLLKLKDLAETQHQAAQTKSFVRERIAAAREILNAGNAGGALKLLQDALKKVPGNAQIESFISIVKERLTEEQDEQAKSRCVQQANEAIGRRAYDEAIQILESGQVRFAASPEIDNLLRFAREQQAKEAKKLEVENSLRRAQEFLRNQEYDQAISLLESILGRTPDEELKIVLEEARRRRDELNRQITAAITRGNQFLNEGSPAKAVEFLQSQPTAFRRSDEFRELLLAAAEKNKPAEKTAEVPAFSEEQLEAPQPQGTMMWGAGIAPPPEVEPKPVPRVPTGRVAPPAKAAPTAKPAPPAKAAASKKAAPSKPAAVAPATPGLLQRLTSRQKIVIGGALAAIVLVVLAIVMWPTSKVGTLIVRSSTDGAEVLVDGKSQGTIGNGHSVTFKLNEGHHVIRLQKDGYDPSSAEIDVVKGEPVEIPLTLTPTTIPTADVSIQTSEDGVDVFIDDGLKGSTSNKQLTLRLPLGQHTVRVEKSGFDTVPPQSLNVAANTSNALKFALIRSKTPGGEPKPADSYFVITGPQGADVKVQGGSPPSGKLNETGFYAKVSPNSSHHVEVSMNGFQPWSMDAAAKPGDRTQLHAELKPIPKPKIPPFVEVFSGTPDTVAPGQTIHLQWRTNNATSVDIEGIATGLEASGSKDVQATLSTTYKLIAKGEGATAERSWSVTVKNAPPPPKPPKVLTFEAKPTKIKAGESTTLTWSTSDAQSVSIDGVESNLPPSGSRQVTPTQTTDYRITANNPSGASETSIHVTVEAKPSLFADESPAIMAALGRLSAAYATQLVGEVKKEWTGITKDQEKGLGQIFNNSGLKAISMQYDQCSGLSVAGTAARIYCVETMSYTAQGKRNQAAQKLAISLKKNGETWRVDTKVPTK